MYTDYFSLKEKPFNLTPSPRFLYLSESHKEALALLTYGVMERKGFVLLTGEVGTGKTTILHTLLGTLDKRVQCVHLSNPLLSPAEFIDYLSHSVFKTGTGNQSKTEFLLRFEEYLRKSAQQQSNFLLVIDEAQKLSFDLLEEIRLLSNMETSDQKLINIFLVGQPELNQKLSEVRCRPLLQRISIRHHISPLNLKETGEYIVTRLKVAGAKDAKGIFSAGVIRAIHRLSKGYPRMINVLADNALLSAYSNGTRRVSARIVEQCHTDLRLGASSTEASPNEPSWTGAGPEKERRAGSGRTWKWGAALVAAGAAALVLLAGNGVWVGRTTLTREVHESPAPDPSGPLVMKPIVPQPSQTEERPAAPSVEKAVQASVEKTVPAQETETIKAGNANETEQPDLQPAVAAGMQEIVKENPSLPRALPERSSDHPQGDPPRPARRVIAKKGDTLSKLAVDVYGKVDERILSALQKNNPSISNIHWIAIGQEIYFPPARQEEDPRR